MAPKIRLEPVPSNQHGCGGKQYNGWIDGKGNERTIQSKIIREYASHQNAKQAADNTRTDIDSDFLLAV